MTTWPFIKKTTKFMTQKKLIIFISVLFILCSSYLFFVSDRSLKSDAEKKWWALSFEDPKSDNLNFTVENHSAQNNFHWEIKADNQKISEGDVEIQTGETKKIDPETKNNSGKISITVSTGSAKKEIYKNIQ